MQKKTAGFPPPYFKGRGRTGEGICESNELDEFLWLIESKATFSTSCIINIPDGKLADI